MKAKLFFNGKEIFIDGIKKVDEFGKISGLMFRKNSSALLFEFPTGRTEIHSFFCRRFLAIWILDGKIVEYRIVKPWRISVKPKSDFDKLIEVPITPRYDDIIKIFVPELVENDKSSSEMLSS